VQILSNDDARYWPMLKVPASEFSPFLWKTNDTINAPLSQSLPYGFLGILTMFGSSDFFPLCLVILGV
jgi:hypothetical protein